MKFVTVETGRNVPEQQFREATMGWRNLAKEYGFDPYLHVKATFDAPYGVRGKYKIEISQKLADQSGEGVANPKRSLMPKWTTRNTELHKWFERDNQLVELRDAKTDRTIIEFRDEDVTDMVESGFLDPRNWHSSLVEYANEMKINPHKNPTEIGKSKRNPTIDSSAQLHFKKSEIESAWLTDDSGDLFLALHLADGKVVEVSVNNVYYAQSPFGSTSYVGKGKDAILKLANKIGAKGIK